MEIKEETKVGERYKLAFYTNMPTPYQLDFFQELQHYFNLSVIYFTDRENDRQWKLKKDSSYPSITLKNGWLTKNIQKKITSFHFSWRIFPVLVRDQARFVIVNGTYWSPNVVLALLISKIRGKTVFFYGEPLFKSRGIIFWVKKNILAFPIRKFTSAIFAIGSNAVESYKALGYKRELYNIPYNIREDLFSNSLKETDFFRLLEKRFKSNDEIVLLSSGALVERKGMDTIIKAFMLLPDQRKVNLLILGDGDQRPALEKMAAGKSNIFFLGFQEKNEIPHYFLLADIFVFASRYDGWGLVINEAVISNNAIICSNTVGAAADQIIDGENGLLLDPEDVFGFKNAMELLIGDKHKRDAFIEHASGIRHVFTSSYNAEKVYAICSRIK